MCVFACSNQSTVRFALHALETCTVLRVYPTDRKKKIVHGLKKPIFGISPVILPSDAGA